MYVGIAIGILFVGVVAWGIVAGASKKEKESLHGLTDWTEYDALVEKIRLEDVPAGFEELANEKLRKDEENGGTGSA